MAKLKYPKTKYKYNHTVYKDLVEVAKPKVMNLKTLFWFGKYKGKSLQYVLQNNPAYVDWCIKNCIIKQKLILM